MDDPTRFDRSALTVLLLLVDAAIIAAQLSYGLITHGTAPLADLLYTTETVAPFLLGWLLVAPMVGLYTVRVRESIVETVLAVAIAWIVAALIGVGLRATPWIVGGAPPTFLLVTVVMGLVTLLPWRLLVTFVARTQD